MLKLEKLRMGHRTKLSCDLRSDLIFLDLGEHQRDILPRRYLCEFLISKFVPDLSLEMLDF